MLKVISIRVASLLFKPIIVLSYYLFHGMKSNTKIFLLLTLFALYAIAMSGYIFTLHMTIKDLQKQLLSAQSEIKLLKSDLKKKNKTALDLENKSNLIIRNISTFIINFDSVSPLQSLSKILSNIICSYNQLQCEIHKEVSHKTYKLICIYKIFKCLLKSFGY